MESQRKFCFAPVVDTHTQLLILGSLPGERSLQADQYYAHPRNQFWTLLSPLIGIDLNPLAYNQKIDTLRAHRVGLWDSIAAANRTGSLDTAIREAETNDLYSLAHSLPALRAIAFNGAKSATLGRKHLKLTLSAQQKSENGTTADQWLVGTRPIDLINLPSSSPAHTQKIASKHTAWAALTPYIKTISTY